MKDQHEQHHPQDQQDAQDPGIELTTVGHINYGFTQISNAFMSSLCKGMSDPAFRLAVIALSIAGAHGTDTPWLSHSYIKKCTEAGDGRIQRMIKDLVAARGDIFTYVPANRKEGRPAGIRVDYNAILELHVQHLNQVAQENAERRGLQPTKQYVAAPAGSAPAASAPKARKAAVSSPALSDADVERFVAVWNTGKHTNHAGKRVVSAKERRDLNSLLAAHKGDVEAALESWTLAVSEVARLGANPEAMFWGKPGGTTPAMANLLAHWPKHSEAARARLSRLTRQAAAQTTYTPPEEI